MARPPRDPAAAARAKEFLETHVTDAITLDQVAGAAGVSRFHVVRIFRRAYGVTPFRYRRLLRLQHARQLLRQGHRPVDVAYRSGYADQSHMCAAFRAASGD
jgi:AraC-like DNA-binding protein